MLITPKEERPVVTPLTCAICKERERTVCAAVPAANLSGLEGCRLGDRNFSAGDILFEQGQTADNLYIIKKGWAILYTLTHHGERQILNFALPGGMLGFHPDLETPIPYSLQALTPLTVCVFPQKNLLEFFRQSPDAALRMAAITVSEAEFAFQHLTNVGRHSAREAVANLLLELCMRVKERIPATGDTIELPLRQEHLADALGLTIAHVNRTLRKLRENGALLFQNQVLRILNKDLLIQEAGADPAEMLIKIRDGHQRRQERLEKALMGK